MNRRVLATAAAAMLAMAVAAVAQDAPEAELEDLDELYAWGAVSSVVEVDEDGDGQLVGFHLHTDEGETFEIVMDDMGRAIAKEASDRTDVVVEVEGRLSVDGLMVTITEFRMVYVDPSEIDEDQDAGEGDSG